MFLRSKNKRQQILKNLNLSRQKDNRSSRQKRRDVQANVDKFINTMNNFKNSRFSFKDSQVQNKTVDNFYNKSQENIQPRNKAQIFNTPSVKDIINQANQSHSLAKQFYQLSDSSPQQIKQPSPQKSPQRDNQINFYKHQVDDVNINNIKEEHSSHRNSQIAADVEDQEIKVPALNFINNSLNQSNNNSDAIFFTSRFQQYLNNKDEPSPKKEQLPQIQQKSTNKKDGLQIQNVKQIVFNNNNESVPYEQPKQDYNRLQKNLKNNASGQSLAFSNDSSLKLSLNESDIHDVISKKLSNQLVLESINNNPYKVIQQLCNKLIVRQNIQDFIRFSKEILLKNHINKQNKINFIDNLMINKQYNFQLVKNQVKVKEFQDTISQNMKRNIFYSWKFLMQSKQQAVLSFIQKRQSQIKNKCFRTFKMIHYDCKINHQVDNYYLSKIFYAFKNSVQKQKKKMNQKIFKCYCRNLKRTMFNALIEGCNKSRRQRQIVELADDHYYFSLVSTVFNAWKDLAPKQQKFIRLAMTTKNILKQTKDNKLLQTKTFDFYQIK